MAEVQLPEDLIVRIFERLPVKPLIKFTCLSKRWRFIILYDPQFAKSHFQIASQNHTLNRRLLFFHAHTHESKSHSLPFQLELESYDLGDKNAASLKIQYPVSPPGYFTRIRSCNGLVLLVLSSTMYIWNPSTGFSKQLPCLPRSDYVYHFGFGYVSSTDDYKVFAHIKPRNVDKINHFGFGYVSSTDDHEYHILSLRSSIWKKVEAQLNFGLAGDCALSNEAIHWLLVGRNDMAVFDLAKEEIRTMLLPKGVSPPKYYETLKCLGTSPGGSLCFLNYNRRGSFGADLWVLREYGVTDSWAKQFTFKMNMDYSGTVEGLVEGTSVLVLTTMEGERYNFKLIRSGHEEEQQLISLGRMDYFGVIDYQETLLPLP